MSPRDAVASAFRQYATFRGRARRSEFWWFVLFTVVVGIVTSTLDTALFGTRSDDTGPLNAIASLALLVPTLALGWRRMHDTDRHGAKYLIGLIPVVGWILVIVWACQDGQPGPNRFGPSPKGGQWTPPGYGQKGYEQPAYGQSYPPAPPQQGYGQSYPPAPLQQPGQGGTPA
ncbi:DUF805 domain-containing protein [Quadrisphaera setariae]|uniref:DUF805 domain-containing protein n=1 Tax=Quadrisphaera setariae TaxID=2593304 RepID=A0A5C8Z6B9_9ACTN|nr:DUF805 domain-containing protein [Quadrisphaera setariae]TXR52894.1 DUF805 domain-containing protein [Quadrisphaera setariae]